MFEKLLLIVGLAGMVSCYDFKDSAFNEYLLDEFRDTGLRAEAATFRFKRDVPDAKCFTPKGKHCCSGEIFNAAEYETVRQAKLECFKEINGDEEPVFDPFDCESATKMKENMLCVSECMTKKFNAISETGEFNRDVVLAHLKVKFAGEQWKLDKSEEVVDKCLAEIKQTAATEKTKCSLNAMQMLHCIWKEMLLNCPAEMQIKTPKCNKIREKVQKNDQQFLKAKQYFEFSKMFLYDH